MIGRALAPLRWAWVFLAAGLVLGGPEAAAQTKAKDLFGAKANASRQGASAVGSYAKGCLAGGVQLPESGPTWQAMRLSRNRNWGHPVTIDFLKDLSVKAARQPGWAGLYIGDISQPRGGPMLSGHQSHQMGLDADVWMLPPKRLNLSPRQRENLSSISVRRGDQRGVNGNWTPQHMEVIKAAASDKRVDRIFVTAPAKIWMCNNARGNKRWLQKVRPFWGHHYHFHVRLKCPRGSRGCITQTPTVRELSKGGTGCDETLTWWVTDALSPPKKTSTKPKTKKKPVAKKKNARQFTMADLPQACQGVLASK